MKELERQISHDRKLRDFMKLKSQERQEDEELVTYRKRKGSFSFSSIFLIFIKEIYFQKLKQLKNVVKKKKNIQLKHMKVNLNKSKKLVMNKI
jgi:hypothetical protein